MRQILFDAMLQDTSSCAVKQLYGLPDYGKNSFADAMQAIIADSELAESVSGDYNPDTDEYEDDTYIANEDNIPAFILMTQATGRTRTKGWVERFADWIEKEKLGVVSRSEPRPNPNGASKVIVFVWAVNRKQFIAWIEKYYQG
jgi:hypothetical protein